jgi:hypothetical protein
LVGEECDTAIESWLARGELELAPTGLSLLKLHGSIDWVVERPGGGRHELPLVRIKKVTADEKSAYERPAVVFGEAGKLRSEGPYLELLLAFSAELKRTGSLLVVGYSFRDHTARKTHGSWP